MVSMHRLLTCLAIGAFFSIGAATPCTTDTLMAGGSCDNTDVLGTEEGNEFLQVKTTATRSDSNESQPEWVQPFNCKKFPVPIQVLKDGTTGFAFKELNVETGKYNTLFSVPFTRTNPVYKDLNSCGMNPQDNIPYCTLWSSTGGHYIVRVGSSKVAFVAKLPDPKGMSYNTGTFAPDGTFFIADQKANFLVIQNLDKMGGAKGEENKEVNLKYADAQLVQPNGFTSAADVVVVAADLEGTGKKKYMIVLNKGKLQVARWTRRNGFTKTWSLNFQAEGANGKGDVWGAGWNFAGRVFFAHNKGNGVFEVPLDELTLNRKIAKPVTLKKIGASEASGFNDGTNCIKGGNPWVTKVLPIDCKIFAAAWQALRVPGKGYAMQQLSMESGSYEGGFFLPFSTTTPKFKYLNAIGVNPKDGTPYGCLLFTEYPGSFFIVRFDGIKIEFVVKVLDKYDPVAGTFNSQGDYIMMQNNEYDNDIEVFMFSDLTDMKGYANPNAKKLPVMENLPYLKLWHVRHFADIVTVKHNLGGQGKKEFVFAMNREQQAVFLDLDKQNISASRVYKYKTNNPFRTRYGKALELKHNFGAAWNFNNRIFFSSNEGYGVVEAKKVNDANRYIEFQKVGKSKAVMNNDGFNCWDLDTPFKNPKDGVWRPAFKEGRSLR
mmetsp:Transcript_71696/g.124378  ORF Transcript_71696/g.124378 Transcript_71696/m.124378 type:complete len:659 (+) Transcript_71696:71-2047(+)